MPIGYDLSKLTLEELKTMRGILSKAAGREVIDVGASHVLPPYPGKSSPGVRDPSVRRGTSLTPP